MNPRVVAQVVAEFGAWIVCATCGWMAEADQCRERLSRFGVAVTYLPEVGPEVAP